MLETRSVTVLSFLSLTAAIQVQITPRTGEVSIGDSKLFLCQGKNSLHLLRSSLANAGRCAENQTVISWSVDGEATSFCLKPVTTSVVTVLSSRRTLDILQLNRAFSVST